MRKILIILLIFLSIRTVLAQEKIYLPIIMSEGQIMEYPIFDIVSESGERVSLLADGSGIKLADPYWQPASPELKGGGTWVDPQTTDGRALVNANYNNVTESIPLTISGECGHNTIANLRRIFNLSVNAQSVHTQSFEQDKVWLEIKPKGDDFLTAYTTIYTINVVGLNSPFTNPFVSDIDKSQITDVTLILEREPFTSPLPPGEIIGPLYNLIKNPDFELWNNGIGNSQPDSWSDLQSLSITGKNNRSDDSKWGSYSHSINVSGSTAIGAFKGVTQIIEDTESNTTYTVLAWVKNDGISNGVGRILVNYSTQLELYRDDSVHGWQLYSGTITTGTSDTVSISIEILSTSPNTDGTFYVDGLMFVEGDYTQEATDNLLGYMSSSHIVNCPDITNLNYVDMWNVPGDVDSSIRLVIENNTSPASEVTPTEIYKKFRVGMRRTNNIFIFDNIINPDGLSDTSACSDEKITIEDVSTSWIQVTEKFINGSELTKANSGRFKLFTRIKDLKDSGDSNINIRVSYTFGTPGTNEVVLPIVTSPIRNEWTILDLTQFDNINFDTSGDIDFPGSLYYKIEIQRDSGTFDVDFDYSLLLPTDGGYVDANMSNPIYEDNQFVVDNTSSLQISANSKAGKLRQLPSPNTGVRSTIQFDNKLWIGTAGNIIRYFDGNSWVDSQVSPDVNSNARFFGIFNGELYTTGFADEVFKLNNDGSWTDIGGFEGGGVSITRNMPIFNNKMWFPTFNNTLYSYDGTSFTLERTFNTGVALPGTDAITIYNDKLYDFINPVNIFPPQPYENWVYNGDTWTEINVGNSIANSKYPGVVFEGKIYWVLGIANDTLYTFDGDEWKVIGTGFGPELIIYNNNLYNVGITTIRKRITDDNWETVVTIPSASIIEFPVTYRGELIFAADNTTLYAYSDSDNWFSITDYKGGGFHAPPRTLQSDSRHRYFFSYDRENFVNNIDDKALIGIGYRPQFFGLIDKESF